MSEQQFEYLPEVRNITDLAATGQMSVEEMRMRMERVGQILALREEFIKMNLKRGIDKDYGPIPGCGDKNVMLKPAAEKLLEWFGYYANLTMIREVEDRENGYFEYQYRCEIRQRGTNIVIAVLDRECNSRESRWGRAGDKPFDIKDNVKAKAQKRAFVGATRIATATSDIFAEEDVPEGGATGNGGSTTNKSTGGTQAGDYGKPISEAQGKRLFAILKNSTITKDQLLAYIKGKYGFEKTDEIGWKVYEDIIKAIESGHLEMPQPAQSATEPVKAGTSAAPAAGAKITVPQIKDMNMLLGELKQTEAQFKEWLDDAFPQYTGKGINDLLSADVDGIKAAFRQWATGSLA